MQKIWISEYSGYGDKIVLKVAFVQQFGLGENGGGPKIFRTLIENQSFDWVSICSQLHPPLDVELENGLQHWIRLRKNTRLDRTRLARLLRRLDPWFARSLGKRIIAKLQDEKPDVVHITPHSPYDWSAAAEYCQVTSTPLLLSVHDDIRYTFPHNLYRRFSKRFKEVWHQADTVFCICQEIGEEYCRRFGKRDFEILTDGVDCTHSHVRETSPNRMKVYFCGLLHFGYVPNFVSLSRTLNTISKEIEDVELVIRGGLPYSEMKPYLNKIRTLPFANDISSDFDQVDLLYLPLPFGSKFLDFARFSLSTKLVGYLASGIPILYHGPKNSALANLLRKHDAAFFVTSQHEIFANRLSEFLNVSERARLAKNAIALTKELFDISAQKSKFAQAIERSVANSPPPPDSRICGSQ